MSAASEVSILDTLVTPAPRYLMRLALIEQLVARLPTNIRSFLEIGPGMGDLSLYLAVAVEPVPYRQLVGGAQ